MKYLPITLIYFRLFSGLLILALSLTSIPYYTIIAVTFFSLGLLSDILDGIIARRLHIANQRLRRLDSQVDQVFFLLVAIAAFIKWPLFFTHNTGQLFLLAGAESAAYLICLVKFRKEVATHAIASKIWALILFATLFQLLLTGNSTVLFTICVYLGVLTRLEIIGILLLLRYWAHDVPSVYHAYLVRRGKSITRHPLFN